MGNSKSAPKSVSQNSIAEHLVIQNAKSKIPMSGLYIIDKDIQSQYPQIRASLPLTKLDYNIEVVNHLAMVTLELAFQNSSTQFLEAQYSFPMDPKIVVHQFRAQFGNVIISGEVKEKEQAKKQYQEGLASGRQVAYGEIDKDSYDIINLKIGNIPPQSPATITIEFVQELEVQMNTLYKLRIPSTISPRYVNDKNNSKDKQWKQKIRELLPKNKAPPKYTWNFALKLKSDSPLTFNNSSTHELLQTSVNPSKTEADFILSDTEIPNKDFLFAYSNQKLMSCTLGSNDINLCAAISFIPRYAQLKADDAYMMMMQNKALEVDIENASGQYIFLLDRSGSMSGGRIKKALEALKLFLKSLPPRSIFNIVSFGSSYETMFQKSKEYNDENLKTALNTLQGYSADLGGTQIEQPLRFVFDKRPLNGYPRQIFLLTDGDVSNTNQVIKLVEDNIKYSRVHTIGIGSGCSSALIKGCAEKGKGKAVFITEGADISSPVIQLLEQSLTPAITQFSLQFDQSVVESIVPNPRSMPFFLKNDPVNFYIIFKNEFKDKTTFTLKYTESVHNTPYENKIQIDPFSNQNNFPFVNKIVHHKTISVLLDKYNSKKPIEEDILIAKIGNLEKQIVDKSVKYQVLCPLTAYICVGKKLVDGKYVEFLEKGTQTVVVPQHKVKDETDDILQQMDKMTNMMACSIPMTKCSAPLKSKSFFSDLFSSSKSKPSKSIKKQCVEPQLNIRKALDMDLDDMMMMQSSLKCNNSQVMQKMQCCILQDKIDMDLRNEQINQLMRELEGSQQQTKPSKAIERPKPQQPALPLIDYLISCQKFDGSWSSSKQLVNRIFSTSELQSAYLLHSIETSQNYVITLAILTWLSKNHNTPAYSLIIKKARTWINKQNASLQVTPDLESEITSKLIIA